MRAFTIPVFALSLAMAQPLMAQTEAQPPAQITVTGEGEVRTAPDIATILLGVTTQAGTAAQAMAENSEQLAKVLANIRAAGVEGRDLQTNGLSLNPLSNYSSRNNDSGIDGYVAINQVSIRIRQLDTLGITLDAAIKDGVNTLNSISFGVADPAPQLDEARKRAIADARHRAELLTEAAGVKLGDILSISEAGSGGGPQPMYARAAEMSAVPVEAGEISLTAAVTVVWQIVK